MEHILGLKCAICGATYAIDEVDYVCPEHGSDGVLDVIYDYNSVARKIDPASLKRNPNPTMWRYKALLPVQANAPVPPLAIGGTPLYPAARLGQHLGLSRLWIKDDGRNPTASFKDRASALVVVKARQEQANVITTASTGNAAAALAGVCAAVGQANVIFVPHTAPQAKVAQLLAFGSTVLLVEGVYDDAFELCLQSSAEFGWYNRNTGYNPYTVEGKKTAALEICEQLNFNAPDKIVVSVGDGNIITGLHAGLRDALALGWIDKIPQLIGVQAKGSNFLYQAWKNNEDPLTKKSVTTSTLADSISAGLPRDRVRALRAVTETGGRFIQVDDQAILRAIPTLARESGVFAEPAAAAALAGLQQAIKAGWVEADEQIVLVITGNGLKDVPAAIKGTSLSGIKSRRIAANADLAAIATATGLNA